MERYSRTTKSRSDFALIAMIQLQGNHVFEKYSQRACSVC